MCPRKEGISLHEHDFRGQSLHDQRADVVRLSIVAELCACAPEAGGSAASARARRPQDSGNKIVRLRTRNFANSACRFDRVSSSIAHPQKREYCFPTIHGDVTANYQLFVCACQPVRSTPWRASPAPRSARTGASSRFPMRP